jgi:hypothetical protein
VEEIREEVTPTAPVASEEPVVESRELPEEQKKTDLLCGCIDAC